MPSKRTIRTRDPQKPITPEILDLFDRSKQLFEMEARDGDLPEHLHDELADIEKKIDVDAVAKDFWRALGIACSRFTGSS